MPRTNKPANGGNDSPSSRRASKKGNGTAPEPSNGSDRYDELNDPDAVAKRAFEIYQRRGGDHGADLDDWLEAERQLRRGPSDVTGPATVKPRRRKTSEETGL
jgi:Protein of unknown function (DUF2934)